MTIEELKLRAKCAKCGTGGCEEGGQFLVNPDDGSGEGAFFHLFVSLASFVGLSLHGGMALSETGAPEAIVGESYLKELCRELGRHGVRSRWINT
eukprot:2786663-Prorocentrum_lima.AAC.1